MNAIQLLKDQHREVDALFQKLDRCEDDADVEILFARIADALTIHAAIEERHFYPAVRAAAPDLVDRSFDAHNEVKAALTELRELDVADTAFEKRLVELQEMVKEHVEEEQQALFPRVESLFDEARLSKLGEEMRRTVAALEREMPRIDVGADLEAVDNESPAPLE
jgi:hemerythrin superfamily protein